MRKLGVLLWSTFLILGLLPLTPTFAQGGDGPTAPPDGTALPLVEVVYEADFTDSEQWPEGTITGMEFAAADGGYQITSINADAGIGLAPPIALSIDNFYSEVSFTIESCQVPESAFLFLTRLTPNAQTAAQLDTYAFVLQCSGDYRSRSITAGNPGDIDVQGRAPAALDEGSQHVMGVLMINNSVTWYLDGTELATYDVLSPLRVDGVLAIGAQRGLGYIATSWRVWSLDSTTDVSTIDPSADTGTTTDGASEGPLSEFGVGDLIYNPDLTQPGSIPTGLSQPVATLYLAGGQVGMYNRESSAILPFEGVQASDYYAEVVFGTRACDDASLIAVIWRAAGEFGSYYAFGMQCDGSYRAWLETPDGPSEPLVSGEVSQPPVPDTGAHSLGVYVKGDTAWLYYDDTVLGSFTDSTLTEGGAGLLLQSDPATAKAMDIVVVSLTVAEAR